MIQKAIYAFPLWLIVSSYVFLCSNGHCRRCAGRWFWPHLL